MLSAARKAGTGILAALLLFGCAAQRETVVPGTAEPVSVDRRPCIAHFSQEGDYWSGHAAKSFADYPERSKGAVFDHILTRLSSLGYRIDSSYRDAGLIGASRQATAEKQAMPALYAAVSERESRTIRVELTVLSGGLTAFDADEVRSVFCSLLEGVPREEKAKAPDTPIREEPLYGKKAPVSEQPVVDRDLPATEKSAAAVGRGPQGPPPKCLMVKKKANLREKADIRSRIKTRLKKGEKLELQDRSGNWYRVKTPSGLTGWIYQTLVKNCN